MKYEEALKLWAINRLKEDKVKGMVDYARARR